MAEGLIIWSGRRAGTKTAGATSLSGTWRTVVGLSLFVRASPSPRRARRG